MRWLPLLLLAACDAPAPVAQEPAGAGPMLERAAITRGLIADPARLDPVGLYASGTDRVCITRSGGTLIVGASVDYGDGQACLARGTATLGRTLDLRLDEGCRVAARLDGDRIAFPATVPAACAAACRGRATLATLTADRLSASAVEAGAARGGDGRALCPAT